MHTEPMNNPNHTPDPWANPCMVVNAGETWPQAVARHRRETGHQGMVFIVAINRGARPARH